MEKILVGIDTKKIDLRPCIHAINLAERMQRTRIYFLLISNHSKIKSSYESKIKSFDQYGKIPGFRNEKAFNASAKKDLESLIEDGRSKGIIVYYYMVEGNFRDELISFIKSHRIDLLVIGSFQEETNLKKEEMFTEFIEKIKHRVDCRIEVVHGKNQ